MEGMGREEGVEGAEDRGAQQNHESHGSTQPEAGEREERTPRFYSSLCLVPSLWQDLTSLDHTTLFLRLKSRNNARLSPVMVWMN